MLLRGRGEAAFLLVPLEETPNSSFQFVKGFTSPALHPSEMPRVSVRPAAPQLLGSYRGGVEEREFASGVGCAGDGDDDAGAQAVGELTCPPRASESGSGHQSSGAVSTRGRLGRWMGRAGSQQVPVLSLPPGTGGSCASWMGKTSRTAPESCG